MHQQEKQEYQFSAKPWQYAGPGGWIFVSLPVALSTQIRKRLKEEERAGAGSVPLPALVVPNGKPRSGLIQRKRPTCCP